MHGGLEKVPFRRGDGLARRGIGHLGDDRDRHGNGRLLVFAIERQPHVEWVEDEALLADVDIAPGTERAELPVAAADIDDADERALRIILLAEIVEQEALARARLRRDNEIIIVDARIEEIERDQLALAPDIEQGRAASAAKVGLHRRHQGRRLDGHAEVALQQLQCALFRVKPEGQAGGEQYRQQIAFLLHHEGQGFGFPQPLGPRRHFARLRAVTAEHPHGRDDRDEPAVRRLVQYPADLLDLLAHLYGEAAGRLLRRKDLRALMDLELRMIEEDRKTVEERSADLVAVLGAPAHATHEPIGALGGDPPRRGLGREASRDLVAQKDFGPFEEEVRSCLDDLARNRGCGHAADAFTEEHAGRGGKDAVEDPAIEADQFVRRQPPDAHFRQLLLDLAAKIGTELHPRLDDEERPEIAYRNRMQRIESPGSATQIIGRAPGRGLDQRVRSHLEVEIGVERRIDQRIGEGDELEDRAFREMDVEKAQQRLLDMGEHIGGGHEFPGLAPAIVDAQEGFFFLDPGDHRQEVRIGIAGHGRAQPLIAEGPVGGVRAHGRFSGAIAIGAASSIGASAAPGSGARIVRSTGGAGLRPPGSTR